MSMQRRSFSCRGRSSGDVRARRAFSLIELLVVIGIIVLLLALTLAVSVTLHRNSDVRRVERTLELLSMALQEWELAAERTITYGTDGVPSTNPPPVYMIQEVATFDELHELTHHVIENFLNRNTAAKEHLARIDPEFLKPHDGELTVFDAWDNDLIVIFPGRQWNSAVDGPEERDDDGTIKTPFELMFGSCANRKIAFVSAGPDGRFGHLHLDTPQTSLSAGQQQEISQAADNLSSYPLLQIRPTS